jgi:hypothetical protein
MTNGERRVALMAERARRESAVAFDVSGAVLMRIREARMAEAPVRPMLWMAAGALAAAAAVLIFSMPYLDAALDPLTMFLEEAATSAI